MEDLEFGRKGLSGKLTALDESLLETSREANDPVANAWYEYTENDIFLLNKARNHRNKYYYHVVQHSSTDATRPSGILTSENGDFIRNSEGGIVLEAPSMAITGLEDQDRIINQYLSYPVMDIIRLGLGDRTIYPAKIIFPYNPSQGHWIAGEIIINKNDREYDVKISKYNPMSDYSEPVDQNFCKRFEGVFNAATEKFDPGIGLEINQDFHPVRIGRQVATDKTKVRIQQGGVACGVYTAYALNRLQITDAEHMWDNFPYDDSGALIQRERDIETVRQALVAGDISQEEYARFVSSKRAAIARYTPKAAGEPESKKSEVSLIASHVDQLLRVLPIENFVDQKASRFLDQINAIKEYEEKFRRRIFPQIFANKTILTRLASDDDASKFLFSVFIAETSPKEREAIISESTDDVVIGIISEKIQQHQEELDQDVISLIEVNDEDIAASIQSLEKLIEENRQDTELLSHILFSICGAFDNKEIKITKATMLLTAGAEVTETMIDEVTDKELRYILVNEYLLQLLKTGSKKGIRDFIDKYAEDTEKNPIIDLDYCSLKDGSSILHSAVQNEDDNVFQMMFVGDQKNLLDYAGHSPLMIAVLHGNVAAAEILIDAGADLYACDKSGASIAEVAQTMLEIMRGDAREVDYKRIAQIIDQKIHDFSEDLDFVSDSSHEMPKHHAFASEDHLHDLDDFDEMENITTPDRDLPLYPTIYGSDLLAQANQIKHDQNIKRERFTIDRSDFFPAGQKSANYILLTADEISFRQHINANGTQRSTLDGSYRDIFQPFNSNPAKSDFQPYYANFGGLYFFEQPGGKKIFDDAKLFMANFRNCIFKNVDFSNMQPEIFATMQFRHCVFSKCIFPPGILIDEENNIKPDSGIKAIADQIRGEAEILRRQDGISEEEKSDKIEQLVHNLTIEIVPQSDANRGITRKGEGSRISLDRLNREIPNAQGIRNPIAHQCVMHRCTVSLPRTH